MLNGFGHPSCYSQNALDKSLDSHQPTFVEPLGDAQKRLCEIGQKCNVRLRFPQSSSMGEISPLHSLR